MKTKKTNYVIVALVVILLLLAVGYAAFNQLLTITGTAKAKGDWDIHFENAKIDGVVDTDAEDGNAAVLENSSTPHILTVNVLLTEPGAKKTVTVDIVNKGSVDAKLTSFTVKAGADTASEADISAAGGVYNVDAIKMTLAPLATSGDDAVLVAKTGTKTYTMTFEWPSTYDASSAVDQTATFTIEMNYDQVVETSATTEPSVDPGV